MYLLFIKESDDEAEAEQDETAEDKEKEPVVPDKDGEPSTEPKVHIVSDNNKRLILLDL